MLFDNPILLDGERDEMLLVWNFEYLGCFVIYFRVWTVGTT